MKKKIYFRALLATLLLLLNSTSSFARDFSANNDDGKTLYYNITSSEDLTVEVTCYFYNSSANNIGFSSGDIVIPSTVVYNNTTYSVTSIGDYAFYYCSGFTSVVIPNSVTSIGDYSFSNCTKLTSLEIPNSVVSIGEYAFSSCSALTKIKMPDSLTAIPNGAFMNCSGLTDLTIPNSVSSIGTNAFRGCSGLTEFTIPIGVTSIEDYTFLQCSGLTEISIPNSITSIGKEAFETCKSLTQITIPNIVTTIGDYAFSSCTGLAEITIPESITSIGDNVFKNCTNLQEVNYNAIACTSCGSSDNPDFNNCTNFTTLNIGSGVTTIPSYLFYGCTRLDSVSIPESITSIGDYAFGNCTNLYSWSQSTTQLTCQAKLKEGNIFGAENMFAYNNTYYSIDENGIASITGLLPDKSYSISYAIQLPNGECSKQDDKTVTTSGLNLRVTATITPDSYTATGSYNERDAVVKETGFTKYTTGDNLTLTNLEPETEYTVEYYAVISSGQKYTTSVTFTTPAVEFTTLPAVATSNTVALLEATTNLSNDAVGAGFEWRRYDAPDLVPSTFSECPVMEGDLMGTLNGLSSNTYYSYRPYYTSPAGNSYYGDWLAFITADAYVYFEPVVKTYAVSEVSSTSASVKGYAVQGSDNITSQGFEYWANDNSSSQNIKRVSTRADDVTRIEVSGNWMTATFEDLMPGTEYSYRAFVTTDVATTYGETMTFTTEQSTGIGNINADSLDVHEVARYTISGKRINTPQSGINIIRYSDGSVKKVYVK